MDHHKRVAESYAEAIDRLRSCLPPVSELEYPGEQDRLSRAALGLVLTSGKAGVAITPDSLTCPNCGAPTESQRTPYCGETCREQSGFVRHMRTGLTEGTIFDEDRQIALGQVLWHILGGGYPRRQALILERSIKQVFKRENGLCEGCGAPATMAEQVGSGCGRSINLRAVCPTCARTKPYWDVEFQNRPETVELLKLLAQRICAKTALRICDDNQGWDWRAYIRERLLLTPFSQAKKGQPT